MLSTYEEEKRLKAERRKLEKEEARLLVEIGNAEADLKKQETALADPAVYSDGNKSRAVQVDIERLGELVTKLSIEWENVVYLMEDKV